MEVESKKNGILFIVNDERPTRLYLLVIARHSVVRKPIQFWLILHEGSRSDIAPSRLDCAVEGTDVRPKLAAFLHPGRRSSCGKTHSLKVGRGTDMVSVALERVDSLRGDSISQRIVREGRNKDQVSSHTYHTTFPLAGRGNSICVLLSS